MSALLLGLLWSPSLLSPRLLRHDLQHQQQQPRLRRGGGQHTQLRLLLLGVILYSGAIAPRPVSETHLTLPTNRIG